MAVIVEDVKRMLPSYKGLTDDQIDEAINLATAYLNGVNPNWEDFDSSEHILKLAAVSMTLKLHFPQNVNQYTQLDNNVMEMLQSMWNSANMIKRRGRFMRIVQSDD